MAYTGITIIAHLVINGKEMLPHVACVCALSANVVLERELMASTLSLCRAFNCALWMQCSDTHDPPEEQWAHRASESP
jgi:hypothetical protein